jgi:hypothetical protein
MDSIYLEVVKAIRKSFAQFQPRRQTSQELLIRELALDGGLRPGSQLGNYQTLRFKYAIEGCTYVLLFEHCRTKF